MVFCSRCGTEYVHNAKFCHKCGKEAAQTVSINDDSSAAVSTGSLTRAGTSTSQSTGSGSSRLVSHRCVSLMSVSPVCLLAAAT